MHVSCSCFVFFAFFKLRENDLTDPIKLLTYVDLVYILIEQENKYLKLSALHITAYQSIGNSIQKSMRPICLCKEKLKFSLCSSRCSSQDIFFFFCYAVLICFVWDIDLPSIPFPIAMLDSIACVKKLV